MLVVAAYIRYRNRARGGRVPVIIARLLGIIDSSSELRPGWHAHFLGTAADRNALCPNIVSLSVVAAGRERWTWPLMY